MTTNDINRFIQEDNLKCLIVEATNESAYGFNHSIDVEKAAAIQVVMDKDDFTVIGWSIGKIIPNWVKSFDEWNIYISEFNQVKNAGDRCIVDHEKLRNEDGLQQNVEAVEKDIFDNLAEEIEDINGKVNHNLYLKVQPEHNSSNVKTKFDGNADMFDVCGDELNTEVSTNITKANKSKPVEVDDVCGPFMNSKTGQGSCSYLWSTQKSLDIEGSLSSWISWYSCGKVELKKRYQYQC